MHQLGYPVGASKRRGEGAGWCRVPGSPTSDAWRKRAKCGWWLVAGGERRRLSATVQLSTEIPMRGQCLALSTWRSPSVDCLPLTHAYCNPRHCDVVCLPSIYNDLWFPDSAILPD
jgi:hypothetical protein